MKDGAEETALSLPSFDVLVINILMGPGCATGVLPGPKGGNIEKS